MIFLDSSDPKEIKDITAWGVLSGITTNPLIIAKEAGNVDLEKRIREIIAVLLKTLAVLMCAVGGILLGVTIWALAGSSFPTLAFAFAALSFVCAAVVWWGSNVLIEGP